MRVYKLDKNDEVASMKEYNLLLCTVKSVSEVEHLYAGRKNVFEVRKKEKKKKKEEEEEEEAEKEEGEQEWAAETAGTGRRPWAGESRR